MIVSINQPAYLPWLGYFDRIYRSDLAVILDHVQFEKGSVVNRNKILAKNGPQWLTVPVTKTKGLQTPITELLVGTTGNWKKKHKETIRQCYSKTKYFEKYFETIAPFYDREWGLLNELLQEMTACFLEELSIATSTIRSSELNVSGTKSELVLNLCKDVGATQYISGPFGREYLDRKSFEEENIEILFHDYTHPCYEQNSGEFVPYLSVLDLLFRCGTDSLKILSKQKQLGSTW